jgi:hypothetical protein
MERFGALDETTCPCAAKVPNAKTMTAAKNRFFIGFLNPNPQMPKAATDYCSLTADH